jgi:hypothetical protein
MDRAQLCTPGCPGGRALPSPLLGDARGGVAHAAGPSPRGRVAHAAGPSPRGRAAHVAGPSPRGRRSHASEATIMTHQLLHADATDSAPVDVLCWCAKGERLQCAPPAHACSPAAAGWRARRPPMPAVLLASATRRAATRQHKHTWCPPRTPAQWQCNCHSMSPHGLLGGNVPVRAPALVLPSAACTPRSTIWADACRRSAALQALSLSSCAARL